MSLYDKKLINDVADCVAESLRGVVALNPALRLLEGHNVVLRADLDEVKYAQKVTLLSGGGSGHEPGFTGFIGHGMLTGSVCGAVFTSPPPASILAAIRAVSQGNTAGTLLIVLNYTGDRLNFGLALEKARREGHRVEMVTIGDDCALTVNGKNTGRRGLAGMIMVQKVAGQLAEEGCSLEEIASTCRSVASGMGTVGLTLAPCTPPGSVPSFHLDHDEMELGLGIHGEAGVGRIKVQPANQAIQTMLDHMTEASNRVRFPLNKGDSVALLVNNLGGVSVLEMTVVLGDAIVLLEKRGVQVDRAFSGSFVTSLNMAGISLTLLHLDDTRRRCLDAPTRAPSWVRPYLPTGLSKRVTSLPMSCIGVPGGEGDIGSMGPAVDSKTEAIIRRAVEFSCTAVGNCWKQLNTFDTESGDGDSGDTLKRGADGRRTKVTVTALLVALPVLPVLRPHNLLLAVSTILEQTMGGTSGALYSIFLTAAAGPLLSDVTVNGWCKALSAGNKAVMSYGGAMPGDRTLVDALYAAQLAAECRLQKADSPLKVFAAATEAAEQAAISTTKMSAHAGRASYVDPLLLTQPDPGAHAVGILMRAAYEAVKLD